MDYKEYRSLVDRAGELFKNKDYDGSISVFRSLVDSDISDVDKSMFCVNIANACDALGRTDEAMVWYSRGVDLENRTGGFIAAEYRAAYLAQKGRDMESVAHYQLLMDRANLSEGDKHRIRTNLETLENRINKR